MFGFSQVWCCDTEYGAKPDKRFGPDIRCLVLKELYGSAPPIRLWVDELRSLKSPPFDIENSLFIAYNVTAELQCFLELGWPMPRNVIDLWAEYRAITNGRRERGSTTRLIDALAYYQVPHIGSVEKEDMRKLAMRGATTDAERNAILDYCESDVDALIALLRSGMAADMAEFHPREMLFRGRFMVAQTRSERTGLWVDTPLLDAIKEHRAEIYRAVIDLYEEDNHWGVFENGRLRLDRCAEWLAREGIKLPLTKKTKRPSLKSDVLTKYQDIYPQLKPFVECRKTLEALSDFKLEVDAEGRHHFFANNFSTATGRNASKEFIMLMPSWARYLGKPPPGWGMAYLDFSAQEIIIAAVLSGDSGMVHDYYDDIYLQQAIKQGHAPEGATKDTHHDARDRFKPLVLGINYGQTEFGLAPRLKVSIKEAAEMRRVYLSSYKTYADWTRSITNGIWRKDARYFTKLGWPFWANGTCERVGRDAGHAARALSNHPMQSTGADMMRIVMIAATEAGIEVCCSLHDGFIITAPLARLDDEIARMTTIMKAAGAALLGVKINVGIEKDVRWPGRLGPSKAVDESRRVWGLITQKLQSLTGVDFLKQEADSPRPEKGEILGCLRGEIPPPALYPYIGGPSHPHVAHPGYPPGTFCYEIPPETKMQLLLETPWGRQEPKNADRVRAELIESHIRSAESGSVETTSYTNADRVRDRELAREKGQDFCVADLALTIEDIQEMRRHKATRDVAAYLARAPKRWAPRSWKNQPPAFIQALVRRRARGKCEDCGGPPGVFHHLHYRTVGCELPSDLVYLCRDCHTARHVVCGQFQADPTGEYGDLNHHDQPCPRCAALVPGYPRRLCDDCGRELMQSLSALTLWREPDGAREVPSEANEAA